MFDLIRFFSQCEMLQLGARYLSSIDLFHAALTSSDLYVLILRSKPNLERLKLEALCDGPGLRACQEFTGPFKYPTDYYRRRGGIFGSEERKYNDACHDDAEIEVRIWNIKCDEVNALPCITCNINVCEVSSAPPLKFSRNIQDVFYGQPLMLWPGVPFRPTRPTSSPLYC